MAAALARAFGLALLATSLPSQDGKRVLRPSPQKGSALWFVESSRQTHDMSPGGLDITVEMQLHRAFTVTVRQVSPKGWCVLEIELKRVHGALNLSLGQPQTFDSLHPEQTENADSQMRPQLRELLGAVGRKFVARVDQHGRVHGSLEGVASQIDRKPAEMWSGDALRQLTEETFGRLPSKAVEIGDHWHHEQHAPPEAMPLSQHTKIELRKLDDATIETKLTGTLEKTLEQPANRNGATKPANDTPAAAPDPKDYWRDCTVAEGKITGTQRISRRDGFVLASHLTGSAIVTVKGAGPAQVLEVSIDTKLARSTEAEAMDKPANAPARDPNK